MRITSESPDSVGNGANDVLVPKPGLGVGLGLRY